ncbi:hypothetical protein AMECASPLE_011690 [Ameca splendens]|uniref:Uncharacterized protein n=1 Tax=Ameca splendens TaxID=208324 RepID=A0ABV0YMY6_9TELE
MLSAAVVLRLCRYHNPCDMDPVGHSFTLGWLEYNTFKSLVGHAGHQVQGVCCTPHVHGQFEAQAAGLIEDVINRDALKILHIPSLRIHVLAPVLRILCEAASATSGRISASVPNCTNALTKL